ncbi:stonustoxin subunit beta-like [Synchiropus splendidus]|uniref:stonustoxin subunit beta-like n=1 Tax=Synchiropus splendidus TaxID=270530 RepID=UPI00237E347B|nr:stonustoxin subunit beta-like [Synchiropus splendidus]
MASSLLTIPAMGRPFTLGMLYDARKDEQIPGFTLWDEASLQNMAMECALPSSKFEIAASDSTTSQSSLLDVNASLSASFLGGLIEVGGSAKYLNEKKKFKNQSRVILEYSATTSYRELNLTSERPLNSLQKEIIDRSMATHMVTAIVYGANAFFVFESQKLDASSVQMVKGSMEAVIKKIPSFNISGKVEIQLTEEEKALTETFSCKFYGDFILESNPATFEDAVRTYVQLPKVLKTEGKTSPVMVWLMPLSKIYSQTGGLQAEISTGLVRKVRECLEELIESELECNDLLEEKAAKYFPAIKEKLRSFQKHCQDLQATLQRVIKEKLPAIRGGKDEEKSLENVLKDIAKSPFSHRALKKWLEDQEREVTIINSVLNMMSEVKVISQPAELDYVVLAADVHDTLCFVFTSLESKDGQIQQMSRYLDGLELKPANSSAEPKPERWFQSDEVLSEMMEHAQYICRLAAALKNNKSYRFLVAAIENPKHQGGTIYHYWKHKLVSEQFTKPNIADVENLTERQQLLWYGCDVSLDPETVNGNLAMSEENKKVTHGKWLSPSFSTKRFHPFHQALAQEGLMGQCYWEVEWSTSQSEDVAVGVCYKGMSRKGDGDNSRLGWNVMSWCLGHRWSPPHPTLYAEHDKHCVYISVPETGCDKLGVFLDWNAGTLTFYKVTADTLSHIHTFRARFSEPLYPAFMIWRESNYIFLNL